MSTLAKDYTTITYLAGPLDGMEIVVERRLIGLERVFETREQIGRVVYVYRGREVYRGGGCVRAWLVGVEVRGKKHDE